MSNAPTVYRRTLTAILFAAASWAALPLSAQAPAAQTPAAQTATAKAIRATLQKRVDSLVANSKFPGVVVGVSLNDGTTFAIAGGRADTAKQEAMKPNARLLLGSVGKTYFAAVALQLVAEGKLDLDAHISKYLGDEAWFARVPNAKDITVRQLMNHTSGLVRYEFNPAVTNAITADANKTFTPEERVSYIFDSPPPFAAGQGWQYSDTNYIVLGMIVEKIMKQPFYSLIERRILTPLNLRNTIPSDRRELPGVVQGYAGAGNPFGGKDAMWENGRMIMNPQMEWAGGGFAASADDLARWARLLYGGNVLTDAVKAQAFQGVPARGLGRGALYGLGVIIVPTDLGATYGHSGFFPGYLTEVRYYADHGFAISLIFNTSVSQAIPGRNPATLLHELARTVAESQPKRGS